MALFMYIFYELFGVFIKDGVVDDANYYGWVSE